MSFMNESRIRSRYMIHDAGFKDKKGRGKR